MKTLLAAIFFAVVSLNVAHALDTNRTFYVSVAITGDASEEIGSYIKRELRGLNDVVVTDENYRTCLNVVVTALKGQKSGRDAGYAASCAITTGGKNEPPVLVGQAIVVDTSPQKIADYIVTQFDTTMLEETRKTFDKPSSSVLQTNANQ